MNIDKKEKRNIYDIFIEEEKETVIINKNKYFETQKSKKGRKLKNSIKNEHLFLNKKSKTRIHSKNSDDNLRNKIFTHFLSFIIDFLNDYAKKFINQKKDFFKGISYKYRQKLSFEKIEMIMSFSIRDFCEKIPVSIKYKTNTKLNFTSFNLFSKFFDEDFINMKICNLYKYCYYPNDLIKFKKYFGLNNSIENFEFLLDKYKNEIEYRNKLKLTGEKLLKYCNEDYGFYFNYLVNNEKSNNIPILFEDNSNISSNISFFVTKEDSFNDFTSNDNIILDMLFKNIN